MLRRKEEPTPQKETPSQTERITSVLGDGTNYQGKLTGRGGVRIEGAFNGEITLDGLLVVGTTGRVTCENLCANSVIVAGAIRGDITAIKVEIRSTGRVWGNVTTTSFSTEEGAFLRGQIQMEEEMELEFPALGDASVEASPASEEE
ncbi:MAG: polymer-forming cytoskeletal protein [Anaerolineales bacterium]|jgi:cytoskeletal protein CcmA (bactofilin family)